MSKINSTHFYASLATVLAVKIVRKIRCSRKVDSPVRLFHKLQWKIFECFQSHDEQHLEKLAHSSDILDSKCFGLALKLYRSYHDSEESQEKHCEHTSAGRENSSSFAISTPTRKWHHDVQNVSVSCTQMPSEVDPLRFYSRQNVIAQNSKRAFPVSGPQSIHDGFDELPKRTRRRLAK
mmetsp:Transcript_14588/g.19088  ORF Transcript_14588/g.19088 Transcript_14588/m.19088 type:complete len:179 (-) Transcript_14588:311-847(-)